MQEPKEARTRQTKDWGPCDVAIKPDQAYWRPFGAEVACRCGRMTQTVWVHYGRRACNYHGRRTEAMYADALKKLPRDEWARRHCSNIDIVERDGQPRLRAVQRAT